MSRINFLVEENSRVYVRTTNGWFPPNLVGIVPNTIAREDFPYVRYREVPHPSVEGEVIKEIYLDEVAKLDGSNAAKQEERNRRLRLLRSMRDEKMLACDNITRDLALGERSDQIAIRDYRQALKDITEDYKYANDDNRGKAALDAFDADLSDFTWPQKP